MSGTASPYLCMAFQNGFSKAVAFVTKVTGIQLLLLKDQLQGALWGYQFKLK